MIFWMEMATSALSIKRVERLGAATWIQTAAVVALTTALYVRVIPDLAVEWWTEEASSYGMLVPPMAFYIAFQRRQITLSLPAKPDVRGLWLVGLACMVFLAGR